MVWPPFSLTTASILLGMLSIRFWHIFGLISFHSSTTLSHNSWTPLAGILYCWSCHLRWFQRCSIGFKSGDWAGHSSTWILLSSNNFFALLEVCLGSLSYWKILSSSSISNFSKFSTIPSSKIAQYCSAFIFSSTSTSFPTPLQPIQLHTMRLFPPPCLTVGVVVQSDTGSPCCFHTYTFPSDQIRFIFISSLNNTLFQSSTVQFWWYSANSRQCAW